MPAATLAFWYELANSIHALHDVPGVERVLVLELVLVLTLLLLLLLVVLLLLLLSLPLRSLPVCRGKEMCEEVVSHRILSPKRRRRSRLLPALFKHTTPARYLKRYRPARHWQAFVA